jgi:hypothetical protein
LKGYKITWRRNKLKKILARGDVALGTCLYTSYPLAENAKKSSEMGCQFIEFGHDVSSLQNIWEKTLADVRGAR